MSKYEKKIEELGLTLPAAPTPMANYVTARRSGNLLFFSGACPFSTQYPCLLSLFCFSHTSAHADYA